MRVHREEAYIEDILKKMQAAAEEDAELNRQGKPAVKKLELLDPLYDKVLYKGIHEELLDKGVLKILRRWLEPLPDRSLPNDRVKKTVLKILALFSVEKEHLCASGIGKIVLFYSKNPGEKQKIREEANNLVLKWIRVATSAEAF